jgi:gliding motility-associated-like protein
MEEWYIYVPNTFTPDGLLFNNTFKVSTIGIQSFEISIYNRWGEKIFNSQDKDFEWNGTFENRDVQDGTYSWKIDYVTNEGYEETITGHINVLR